MTETLKETTCVVSVPMEPEDVSKAQIACEQLRQFPTVAWNYGDALQRKLTELDLPEDTRAAFAELAKGLQKDAETAERAHLVLAELLKSTRIYMPEATKGPVQ